MLVRTGLFWNIDVYDDAVFLDGVGNAQQGDAGMRDKMEFYERTKFVLAQSLRDIMRTTPLDKVTVRQIVENCSTTRQTFYRNFKDKYELVTWYFDKLVQETFGRVGVSMTLREGLIKKLTSMQEDKLFFTSAFSSSDYNNLLDYDYACVRKFYGDIASKKGVMSEKTAFLLDLYCHGAMNMIALWAKGGMETPAEQLTDMLIEAMPELLKACLCEPSDLVKK